MTKDIRGTILWADDEIDFLKSHILFLEEKGYIVHPVNSGEDAFDNFQKNKIDIVLLDEMMTGMDGIETLKKIKSIQPDIPIIMITKNEEEWLMEEAIASQISNYLIKPVNPTQIFMACKNALEKAVIRTDHISKDFLASYQTFSQDLQSAENIEDWFKIHDKLCNWIVDFDYVDDSNLTNLLKDQINSSNKLFNSFISQNYKRLISSDQKKYFTPYTIKNNLADSLSNNKKSVLVIIDCLRADQWKTMANSLYSDFQIKTNYQLSLIPSTTFYSRNAIFSGYFPIELYQNNSNIYNKMLESENNYNRFEHELLKDQLHRMDLGHISSGYIKVSSYDYGRTLPSNIKNYKNIDLLCIVVNFVDILAHSRSESNVLKEVLTDEASYRDIISSWVSNSWFREVLNEIRTWNREIILTSDHGSTMIKKPVQLKAYKDVSSGVRYKTGRNLKVKDKYALRISNPKDFKIPSFELNENYLIALDKNYFVFPNNYNQFVNKYDNTFQHGGISMDELIVPLASLQPK
tara:strand:+ start:288 stop:1847 length:1560 start_codon:yes stop_codon:yes gene_type:complete